MDERESHIYQKFVAFHPDHPIVALTNASKNILFNKINKNTQTKKSDKKGNHSQKIG